MRIGVVGLGFMGVTHLRAYRDLEGAEVVAVCDMDENRLRGDLSGIQGNIGGPGEVMDFSSMKRYKSLRGIANDAQVEALDICLPTDHHRKAVVAALRAGKHVLVEKPMALTPRECQAMIEAQSASGKTLMVAQVLRFWPEYVAARDLVRSGRIGKVRWAGFNRRCGAPTWCAWMVDPKRSGGALVDLLVHDVDFAQYLFGPPQAVSAVGVVDYEHDIDLATTHLEYVDREPIVVSGGWFGRNYPFNMGFTIVGDEGTLEYNLSGPPLTLYHRDGTEEKPLLPQEEGYRAELAYFIRCASENREPEECRPQDSAASMRIAKAIDSSRQRGGKRVVVKLS